MPSSRVCTLAQTVLVVKNLPAKAGDLRDTGEIPGSGRSPREGNGNPVQYSCLENPMGRGGWQATVHGVTKSQTQLSDFHYLFSYCGKLKWKESAHSLGDLGLIPGSGRSPGGGHGNPLQYSCLEKPMDRGAWRATVCGTAARRTRLSD